MLKQYDNFFKVHDDLEAVPTDGCFWCSLLYIAEQAAGKVLSREDIRKAYHYSIPTFMEDHRVAGESRCYITWKYDYKGHEEIIKIALALLDCNKDTRNSVKYVYREDRNEDGTFSTIIGNAIHKLESNYWISKCALRDNHGEYRGGHFYVSDIYGHAIWNPGHSYTRELISRRGFYIEECAQ